MGMGERWKKRSCKDMGEKEEWKRAVRWRRMGKRWEMKENER